MLPDSIVERVTILPARGDKSMDYVLKISKGQKGLGLVKSASWKKLALKTELTCL